MMLLGVYVVAGIFAATGLLLSALTADGYKGRLASFYLFASLAALALSGLTTGIYFNYDDYFGDFWTVTEAINKAREGQLSSVDFFSPIGPVYYYVYTLTLWIDPVPKATTVMQASAIAAVISSALAVVMLWRRISALGLALVLLSMVTVAVSGRGNGELLKETAMHFIAPYNRWAWALFIPVALRLALPQARWSLIGDLALGLAIALLFLTKITYGAAALGLLAARVVLLRGTWRDLPVTLGAMLAALAAVEITTGQITAHLRDLAVTASLPLSGLRIPKLFSQLGEMALFSAVALVAYLATFTPETGHHSRLAATWEALKPILMILLVAGAGCAVLMQNHYSVEAAVYPLLPLIALEWTGALRPGAFTEFRARILIGATTLFIAFYPAVDIGMHVGQRLQYRVNGIDPGFAGTPYADLKFEPFHINNPNSISNNVSDGRRGVLEGYQTLVAAGAGEPGAGRVLALAFSNPFPMMLGQPSPRGAPIWLHENRSYSREVFPDPEMLFEGVDFVMVAASEIALFEIYRDTLARDFTLQSENRYWILYVRTER